jgi:hypothetical protein
MACADDAATETDVTPTPDVVLTPPPPTDPALIFRDITEWAGLGGLPATAGPGVAAADVDDDGDDDLLVPTESALLLLRNRGDGSFGPAEPIADSDYGWMVYAAELTGDGKLDLVLSQPRDVRLFEGHGDGTFTRSTRLETALAPGEYSVVTYGDYAFRGRLSLVLARHYGGTDCERTRTADSPPCNKDDDPGGLPDLRIPGEDGHFTSDDSLASLVGRARVKAAATADLNQDGLVDLWLGQDSYLPGLALLSNGQGGFVDAGAALGLNVVASAMGFDGGDIDGDGDADFIVANLLPGLQLFDYDGGRYTEVAAERGFAELSSYSTWGVGLIDVDHDGDLDLLGVGGFGAGEIEVPTPLERIYFAGDGAGHFERRYGATGSGLDVAGSARGAAFADFDRDGDVDMVVASVDGPLQLLRNELGGGNWLEVRLDYPWHRPAVGAVVTVTAGDRTWKRWVIGTPSYGGSSSEWVHVGLGDAASIDAIEVRWPNGVTQRELGGPARERRVITFRGARD